MTWLIGFNFLRRKKFERELWNRVGGGVQVLWGEEKEGEGGGVKWGINFFIKLAIDFNLLLEDGSFSFFIDRLGGEYRVKEVGEDFR